MFHLCFRYKGELPDKHKEVGWANADAGVAICKGDFANRDRDCSISLETGDLTLGSVQIQDEGPYVCRKGFNSAISNSTFVLRQLNVNGTMFPLMFVLHIYA